MIDPVVEVALSPEVPKPQGRREARTAQAKRTPRDVRRG